MKKKYNLLVIGSSSYLVSNKFFFDYFKNHYEIFLISSKNSKFDKFQKINFLKDSNIKFKFKNITFDGVLILNHIRYNDLSKSLIKNFNLNKNIIKFIKKIRFKKIMYLSTYSVYCSKSLDKEIFKVDPLNNPDSIYAISKLASEQYFSANIENLMIIRIPNLIDNHSKNKSSHLNKNSLAINGKSKRYFASMHGLYKKINYIILSNTSIKLFNLHELRISNKKAHVLSNNYIAK